MSNEDQARLLRKLYIYIYIYIGGARMKYTIELLPPKIPHDLPEREYDRTIFTLVFKPDHPELKPFYVPDVTLPYCETEEEMIDFVDVYAPIHEWTSQLYGDEIGDMADNLVGQEHEREIDFPDPPSFKEATSK